VNKRILELAKQAGYEVDMFGYGHWDMPECKKFAELIIKECAKVADLADENKCEWIGGNILTHFGVEE
jgi:hypothetical protein